MPGRKFMEAFLLEAEDLLSEIDQAALSLETGAPSRETVDQLFRAFHTIKGSAGMLGMTEIVNFTHYVENLLDLIRDGKIAESPKLVDLVLRSEEQIAALLAVERGEPAPDPRLTEKLIADLNAHAGISGDHHPSPTNKKRVPEAESVFLF
jgi:two-component system chemotaxis sensor kinase CheA